MARRSDEPERSPLPVAFSPRRAALTVLIACLLLEIGFVLIDYHVNYGRLTDIGALRRLSNIAREDGLASWFGTTQTLLVALTTWSIWFLVRAQQAPSWRQAGWLIVALTFSYMAVDDGAQIHERLGTTFTVLRERSGADAVGVFPSYAWQVLFLPIFATLGLIIGAFLWRELRDIPSRILVLAALSLFGLAVGLDFLEGLDEKHPWNVYARIAERYDLAHFTTARFRASPYATLRHFSRSLEEFLEMLANTFLWAAFLSHLRWVTGEVRVRLTA